MSIRTLAALSLSLVFLFACGDDESGDKPTCLELGETCHDTQTDLGQECHEFGEAASSTEEQCQEREEECLAECQ
jgi:hypothetical protein